MYNIVTGTILLEYKWYDDRLRWDPKEWNNITEIIMSPTSMWIPNFKPTTQFTEIGNLDTSSFVRVFSSGHCFQIQRLVFSVPYHFDLKKYPNDKHDIKVSYNT